MINHPAVATCRRTSGACPEQYEGTLSDGRWYYLRYRYGWATLGLGHDLDSAIGSTLAHIQLGDDLQGQFDSDEQRDATFAWLIEGRV